MSKEINRIASEYLARLLSQNPDTKFDKVLPVMHLCSTEYSDESCTEYLAKVQSVPERIDVSEEATHVYICRMVPRKLPSYLAGVRRERFVWTYHQSLSWVLKREEAEKLSKTLTERGIQTFFMPVR